MQNTPSMSATVGARPLEEEPTGRARSGASVQRAERLPVQPATLTLVVNRRTKYATTMQIVRRAARRHSMTIVEIPGRGKGSHRWHALVDLSGAEIVRFSLSDHPRELSWTVLRNLEERLAPHFGEKWMER